MDAALLALFAIHLLAFARLGLRRRERYYLALVTTFGLLTAVFAVRLFAPQLQLGGLDLHVALRYAAWAAAAVSISWTLLRVVRRRRAASTARTLPRGTSS